MEEHQLSPAQQAMVTLWEEHLASEFTAKSAKDAVDTMVDCPNVNHIPVLTGGVGKKQLMHFYGQYFIPQMPPDTEIVPISRTVGHDRIIDKFVFKFTHTVQMDWFLPGITPTGKPVEILKVVVVQFQDGKIASERIYWDQASVLVQVGLLDPDHLPVAGVEEDFMKDLDAPAAGIPLHTFEGFLDGVHRLGNQQQPFQGLHAHWGLLFQQ